MAVTKIHSVWASVQKAVDYICNPDKTNGEMLVDSYGCSPATAGAEFDMALSHGSGNGRNKAFHLIQSFAPGEVDAETAHRIGEELAEKLLHGNRSYVIATHVDKQSVHNHIIFCSADNFTGKKFVCRKRTYWDIRRISDRLCEENGLSVIENPQKHTGLSYEDWIAEGHEEPLRDKLKSDIRECIKLSSTYDDFVRLMRERDYEVRGEALLGNNNKKVAKYIRFKAIGYDQFVRGCYRSLGKGFSKEEIAEAIEKQAAIKAMTATIPVKKMEDLVKKAAPYNKLIDRSSESFKDSPWLNRWADKKDLQSVAHAYAQAGDTVQLQEKIDAARKEASGIQASIVEIDKKILTLKELAVSVRSYQDSKKYADAYKKAKNKEKFYENHESQMIIFEAAEREIRAKGLDPAKITYEQITDGISKLSENKKVTQERYKSISKGLHDKEQQMEMISEYMKQNDIHSHERTITRHRRKEHEQL